MVGKSNKKEITKKGKRTGTPKQKEQWRKNIGAGMTKFSSEIVGKLEYAFAIDATIEEACSFAEIHRDTYYKWIKENPELSDRFESLRQKPVFKAREAVNAGLNNYQNAMDYLSRKRKGEFSQRIEKVSANMTIDEFAKRFDITEDNAQQPQEEQVEAKPETT